jgi:hypothetical protein
MKVIVTIAVRNPEWYWSKEKMQESGDYRKEWEAINEDKIWKHVPSDTIEIAFEVKDIKENRNTEYELEFVSADKAQSFSHTIKEVTAIQFIGDKPNEKAEVVVSNSLIHQYIGARQKEYKYYIYFYLKENWPYERIGQLIWISENHKTELENALGIQFTEA